MPKHILAKAVADGTFTSAYGINSNRRTSLAAGRIASRNTRRRNTRCSNAIRIFAKWTKTAQRLPYFDNIIFTVVPDMNAMSLRFLSGESDVDDFIYRV